jgi:hypothetical protein
MSVAEYSDTRPSYDFTALRRTFSLYITLVGYSFVYEYIYHTKIIPVLAYLHSPLFIYDPTRTFDYNFVALVTPLALLPAGYRLEKAAQYLLGVLAVIIFIPAPILFVPFVEEGTFFWVYTLVWSGVFMIALASRFSIKSTIPTLGEVGYHRLYIAVLAFFGLSLLYSASHGLTFANLVSASGDRPAELGLDVLQSYSTTMFVGSIGGFLLAMSLAYKRYVVIAAVFVGFVLAYGIMVIKFAALAPAWLVYIYLMRRYFFGRSMLRYYLTLTAPFAMLGLSVIVLRIEPGTLLYQGFVIADWRFYVIPGAAFNIYYDYFRMHPPTYWSHVNIVQLFVHYPYGEVIADLMKDQYQLGTYQASFLMGDGIAALGVYGIPVICAVYALISTVINTCFRGMKQSLMAMTLAMPATWLINSPLFTTLVTGGLALLCALMLLAPRDASWNTDTD